MSSPYLTNQIVGVITRFRQEPVVIMGDIVAMFQQLLVPEIDRSLLTFLWWENHDICKAARDYEMGVHVFGATSSPSCCNYALKRTAVDSKETFQRNVFVGDLLKSVSDVATAIRLLNDVTEMCVAGGFRLTKIISNRIEVLQSVAETERQNGVKNVDQDNGAGLPTDKVLGINWNFGNNQLSFKVKLNEKPMTRRGMLSTTSKVYDPLGLAGPFLLMEKKILQDLCRKNYNWDEEVPNDSVTEWENWKKELELLENMKMNRSFKPEGFGGIVKCSLHHFSDASQNGYGQASYLRLVDEKGTVHCSLVMGKSCMCYTY